MSSEQLPAKVASVHCNPHPNWALDLPRELEASLRSQMVTRNPYVK